MANKRSNGEGAITFVANRNEWRGSIRDGIKPDGTPNRVYFSSGKGGTRSDVVKKMQEWRIAKQQGYAAKNKLTLYAGIKVWLETFKKPDLKPASYDRLESIITNQIKPRIGHLDVKEITDVVIMDELLNPMLTEGLSMSSVKKAYDAMHAYLDYAAYKDFIVKNPMAMMKLPKQDKQMDAADAVNGVEPEEFEGEGKVEFLSNEEIKKFYSVSKSVYTSTGEKKFPMLPAFVFILNTGLRMGEALALMWTDVDFKTKTISITKNLIIVKNREPDAKPKYKIIIQNTPKSKKSRRVVPLNAKAIEALEELKKYPGTTDGGYVIHTKDSKPVRPPNFQKTLDTIAKAAGIREITVHPLRHTYATKLFEAGVDVKIISEILGHSSTEITYRIYIHVIEGLKRKAVDEAFGINLPEI